MSKEAICWRSLTALLVVSTASVLVSPEENHLLSGNTLKGGQNLTDQNYSLRMQPDCNLVLYEISTGKIAWATGTNGKGSGCDLTLKSDGNLVILDVNKNLVWQTNSSGAEGGSILIIRKDRNVAIYSRPIASAGSSKGLF